MIWADRVGIVLAIVVFGIVIASGQGSDDNALRVGLFLTIAPWFLMRAFDFIFSGKIRGRN